MWRFKRRFLLLYSTKSQLQVLRGCGNGCRRGWNREIREGRCLNRSIGLISNSNAYKSEEHALFRGYLGVTIRSKQSTVTMERSIVTASKMSRPLDMRWRVQMKSFDKRYKNALNCAVGSRSDDRDAPRAIKSRPL